MAQNEQFFTNVYDVVAAYESGFVGATCDPEATERLQAKIAAAGGLPSGAMACSAYGLTGSGAGKLSLAFRAIDDVYPDALPGGAQGRGDCVSWSTRNACLLTMCTDIMSGEPDEVSGKLEGAPAVSDEARINGVLSTEAIYNWRRHGGDGWMCSESVDVVMRESGLWLRKKYDEIGVDFTRYSSKNAGIYGRSTPPESWLSIGKNHLVRTATVLESFEELRDMIANGYGVTSCGGEGFSNQRNEDGVSPRKGSWAHAMAYGAVDDRDVIKQKYGEPLVMLIQSWGEWNSGPRRILGTNIDIPVGAFWVKWSDIKNREMIALSGVPGWPPKKLKDYGSIGRI